MTKKSGAVKTKRTQTRRRKKAASSIEKLAEEEQEPEVAQRKPNDNNLLSTGSTLLNLALSDNPHGGFLKGKYYFMVGDSASGKTFLSMTCFAEATQNPNFKDYRLIYDNVEDGCLMDIERLFGPETAKRIEAPAGTKKNPEYSYTIEDFYYNLDDVLDDGKPFIYVLDSMDSLSSESEGKKFDQQKKAHQKKSKEKDDQVAGSYGDGKAKKNSENIRKVLARIGKQGSILIILCQTRDDLTFGYSKKTRSGGRALKFYATSEIWSSVQETLQRTVKGQKRKIGMLSKLEIKKNRITGKLKTVSVPIYPSYGMDDIGSCVDYLVLEEYWKTSKKKDKKTGKVIKGFRCPEIRIEGSRDKIIKGIEENGLEHTLKETVGKCWKEIEDACSLKRKSKYMGSH